MGFWHTTRLFSTISGELDHTTMFSSGELHNTTMLPVGKNYVTILVATMCMVGTQLDYLKPLNEFEFWKGETNNCGALVKWLLMGHEANLSVSI